MSSKATLRDLAGRLARSEAAAALELDVDSHALARLSVPDTAATRDAEEVCRQVSSESLANHCFRSYAWGVLLGVADGFVHDPELLYVASMLHDVGLTPAYDRGGCFEADGASAARELLAGHAWQAGDIDTVADAIWLHMHEVSPEDSPEAHMLAFGTSADVSGRRALEIRSDLRTAVLDLFPRRGFKRHFSELFEDQARRKPDCVVHRYVRELDFLDAIAAAPYDD